MEAFSETTAEACTIVHAIWSGSPNHNLTVDLVHGDNGWQINQIRQGNPLTVEGAMRLFFDAYLACVRQSFSDGQATDCLAVASSFATPEFAAQVEEIKASFDKGGYDPVLCAQDRPEHIAVDTVFVNDETPLALVISSFSDHYWTVDLCQVGGSWQIGNVTCAGTPEGVARAFYTWYLGNIGDWSSGDFRNLMVERAYRGSPFLTEDYVAEVDALLASFENQPGGYDPLLQAQDIPWAFSVDPGLSEGTAVVHLRFGTETVHHLQLTLVEQGGRWRIKTIEPAEHPAVKAPADAPAEPGNAAPMIAGAALMDTADWQTLRDEQHGFSLQYPAVWVINEFALDGPGMLEDWPVVRSWQLMPPEVAEVVLTQSSRPDLAAPVIVAPFTIDVLVGDAAAFQRAYVPAVATETLELAGRELRVEREAHGIVRYVLSHPADDTITVVVVDMVSEFPGRGNQDEAVQDMLPAFLASFTF